MVEPSDQPANGALLGLTDIAVHYGAVVALNGVSLDVQRGEVVAPDSHGYGEA